MPNGTIFFTLSGYRTTAPACGTSPARWAFDGKTATGQARLSLLLTVWSSGKSISVSGTATCPDWADTESVEYFWTTN